MAKAKNKKKQLKSDSYKYIPGFPASSVYAEIPTYKEGQAYNFHQLPDLTKEHLLKLQNEKGEHLKYEDGPEKSPLELVIPILIVLGGLLLCCMLSSGLYLEMLAFFSIPAVFITSAYFLNLYNKKISPINPAYIITPTQIIEMNYGEVKFWGLHKIESISQIGIQTSESELTIRLVNGFEKTLIDYAPKITGYFDKIKQWSEDYKQLIEAENFNQLIMQNIFYQIPGLKTKKVAPPFRVSLNLFNQIMFSTIITLVAAIGVIWALTKYSNFLEKVRVEKGLEEQKSNYEKLINQTKILAKNSPDKQFIEAVTALLENAKSNNNPRVFLLVEGENTIPGSLENRLQAKLDNEKLIKFPKNIAEGNYAKSQDEKTLSHLKTLFERTFKHKELTIEELKSRHQKIDSTKDSLITIKYKLEMSEDLPTKFVELKIKNSDPQKTKVYYPELVVLVEAIFDIPTRPRQIFNLNTKPQFILPPSRVDGTYFYQSSLTNQFEAARSDFSTKLGRGVPAASSY